MIIVKMTGGLGNQMFQYAFAKAVSTHFKTGLVLDLSWYTNADRVFLLDTLNVSYDAKITNRFVARALHLIPFKKIKEGSPETDYTPWSVIEGYWESYKYFDIVRDVLKKEFTLKSPSIRFVEIAKNISKTNSIAVHVRRGDYLVPHGKYLNTLEYYNKAVEAVITEKKLIAPEITIFSDDKEYCKKEMVTLAGFPTKVFDDKAIPDSEEFALMSLFAHNVISNSTFSWWSAYLNRNPKTVTITPEHWFTDAEKNKKYTAAMIVPGWKMLRM